MSPRVPTTKQRLDHRLVEERLAEDLRQARGLIMAGCVLVDDRPQTKAGTLVATTAAVRLKNKSQRRFVSRAGDKLHGALVALDLHVEGLRCVDVGAATGGFSDCLLQAEAAAVCCVDVGYGLLDDRIRRDPRVLTKERCNARNLRPEDLPWPVDLITVDVSFIGARALLPALSRIANPETSLLIMVKPQFELARQDVPDGGVVRDDAMRTAAVTSVQCAAEPLGWRTIASTDSVLPGPKGNREIFLLLRRHEATP